MKEYTVPVERQITVMEFGTVVVKAESEEEAVKKAQQILDDGGDVEWDDLSDTLDSEPAFVADKPWVAEDV